MIKKIRALICIICSVCIAVFSGCDNNRGGESSDVSVSEASQPSDTSETETETVSESVSETEAVSVKSIIEYDGDFGYKKVGDDLVLAKYTGDDKYVEVPEGVTIIGSGAFSYRFKLQTVKLPESLKVIEKEAFMNCNRLKSVIFSDSVEKIGKRAFISTGLEGVTIPESVTEIGEYAFAECESLKGAEFLGSLEKLPRALFSGCSSLTRVEFPKDLKIICGFSLSGLQTEELHIPDGVEEIEESAFNANKVYLPDSIKKLNYNFTSSHTEIHAKKGNAEIEKLGKSGYYNLVLEGETAFERYDRIIDKKGIFYDMYGDGGIKLLTVDEYGKLKIYNSSESSYSGGISLTLADIWNTQNNSVCLDGENRKLYRLKSENGEEFLLFTLFRNDGKTAEAMELYLNGYSSIGGDENKSEYNGRYTLQNIGGQSLYEYIGENGEKSYAAIRSIRDIYDISFGKYGMGTEKLLTEEFEKTVKEYISRYEVMGEYELEKYIAAQEKKNASEGEKLIGTIAEVTEDPDGYSDIHIRKIKNVEINGRTYYSGENSITLYMSNSYPKIDFDALAEFDSLTELTVVSSRKVSLAGIGKLKELKSLSLEVTGEGGFTDCGEVSGLGLKRLCLHGDFENPDVFGGCTDIEMLLLAPASVHGNGYYSFVEKMPKLKLVTMTFDGKFGEYFFSSENEKYIRENIGEAFAEVVLSDAKIPEADDSEDAGKETAGFMWGNTEITEFPYKVVAYPENMSVKVCGKDILRGEAVEGISFRDGILTLDNVNIVNDEKSVNVIDISGIDTVKIRLVGDNVLDSVYARSINVRKYDGDLEIFGDGTLTVREIGGSIGNEYSSVKIYENARVIGAEKSEDEKAKEAKIVFRKIRVEDNGAVEFDEINCNGLYMYGSSYLKAKRFTGDIFLKGNSIMEVIADADDYEKYKDTYSYGRTVNYVQSLMIGDSARLSVTNYCHEAIFCYPNLASITVSDNGVLEITGNPHATALCLDESALSTLTLNGNSRVEINNALACISVPKIEINGGTLVCNACEGGYAVLIDHLVSPYADFVPGVFINGEITDISCGEMEIGKVDGVDYFYPLQSDGKVLESFSVTVRENEKN